MTVFYKTEDLQKFDGKSDIITSKNIPLNLENVDYDNIDINECEGIIIPFTDENLNIAIGFLVADIAEECDWVIPDYEHIDTSLSIDLSRKVMDFSLIITAYPHKLTEKDIDNMIITKEIVYASLDFYNNPNLFYDNIAAYDIKLDNEELKQLVEVLSNQLIDDFVKF